jgi:hypothetical protein
VREPRAFNRWLILAADSDYWGAAGLEALQHGRHRLRRVYLITGQHDGVAESTLQVRQWLRKAGVPVHISRPKDMGHEVELERKRPMYRAALVWLARGSAHSPSTASTTRAATADRAGAPAIPRRPVPRCASGGVPSGAVRASAGRCRNDPIRAGRQQRHHRRGGRSARAG